MAQVDGHRPAGVGWLPFVGIAALALATRAGPVIRGAGLFGDFGYDDGAYYGASVAFVHGLMPYRDFLFLHPPGIVVLLSPFAALGALLDEGTGMALGRVAFVILGVINAVLVANLASRHSRQAGILAGFLYAAWHAAAAFERTTILMAPQSTLMLLALTLLAVRTGDVSRRRTAAAGALFALATTIQLWSVIPMAAVTAWLALGSTRPLRGPLPIAFLGGAALAGAVIAIPFLAFAGDAMLRQILLDQLGRPDNGASVALRLRSLEGFPAGRPAVPDLVLVGTAAAGLAALVWAAILSRWVRPFVALFVLESGTVLLTPVFFPHYSAWPAPAGAIALGVTGAIVLARLGGRGTARRWARRATIAALVLGLSALTFFDLPRAGRALEIGAVRADISGADCLAADEPILLIELDRIGWSIDAGCELVIDPTGVAYDTDRGRLTAGEVSRARVAAAGYQAAMRDYFGAADAAVFGRPASLGLSDATWAFVRCVLPEERQRGIVLVRLAPPGAPAACPS